MALAVVGILLGIFAITVLAAEKVFLKTTRFLITPVTTG